MTLIQPSGSTLALVARWSTLAFALFLVGSYSFVIAGVMPAIAYDLDSTPTLIGYTITMYAIVIAVLAPMVAVAGSHISRTTLMVAALAVFVVGVAISAVAPTFLVFAIGRVVAAIGGAALIPTATAAGAAITPPAQRGRAIAVIGIGFTLATAVSAPLSSAIAAVSSWRVPMLGLGALGVVVLPVIALLLRRIPRERPLSIGRRLAVLRDARIVMPLLATTLVGAGFNLTFTFSAVFTGYEGQPLAALLLAAGLMSIVGNSVSGPLTDRFGSRRVGVVFIALDVVALGAIALAGRGFVGLTIGFLALGLAAFAALVPLQHRLLTVDPGTASVAISWFSTALYTGIAFAPLAAAAVLSGDGDGAAIPIAAAALTALGLLAFTLGFPSRKKTPGGGDMHSAETVGAGTDAA